MTHTKQGDKTMTTYEGTSGHHAEFTPLSTRLAYYTTEAKSVYAMRWSKLFRPSDTAKSWDGADGSTTHCSWSDVGECYVYITIKVTGRQATRVPGSYEWGTRVRVTFNAGTEDESTASGWVVAS